MTDDGEHLDLDTVEDWAMLVTAFVAEWMDLEGFIGEDGPEAVPREESADIGRRWEETVSSKTEL